MATRRSRSIDDTHPRAKYLFQAADLGPEQTLSLTYATEKDAMRASWSFRAFRDRGKLAAPDTFDRTKVDPQGEGVGHFDHIVISCNGKLVTLRQPDGGKTPEPIEVAVSDA